MPFFTGGVPRGYNRVPGYVTLPEGRPYDGETTRTMKKSNRSVAARTLIMAAILMMGLVATMFAKGLISTTVLAS